MRLLALLLALGASPLAAQAPSWGRDSTGARLAWAGGFTGQGVKVAMIDTGDCPALLADAHVVGRFNAVFYEDGIDFGFEDSTDASNRGGTNHGCGTASQVGSGAYGVAPGAQLLICRAAAPAAGTVTAFSPSVVRCVYWAVAQGARVINLSIDLGNYPVEDRWVALAIADARAAGVLVVAATGNNGGQPSWPGADTNALAVGAIDQTNAVASFSGRPPLLVAPGVNVNSYSDNNPGSGTSRAAPYVAGAAALVLSAKPSLTLDELANALLCTAVPLSANLPDPASGWGRVDAARAVAHAVGGVFVAGSTTRTYPGPMRDSVQVVSTVPISIAPNRSAAVLRNGWLVFTASASDTLRLIRSSP